MAGLTNTLNKQFEDWGIPVQFEALANYDGAQPIAADIQEPGNLGFDPDTTLTVSSCAPASSLDGLAMPHSIRVGSNVLKTSAPPHEIGHHLNLGHVNENFIRTFPDPDFQRFLCSGSATIMLPTLAGCKSHPHPDMPANFGILDLCELKKNYSPENFDAIAEKCGSEVIDKILEAKLAPMLGYFVSNACAEVIERSLNQLFARTAFNPEQLRHLECLSKGLASLAQALILSQMSGGLGLSTLLTAVYSAIAKGATDTLPIGRTLRALVNLAGHLNLTSAILQALSGNGIGAIAGMAAAYGGKFAGCAASAILWKAVEMCAPVLDEKKRAILASPSARHSPFKDEIGGFYEGVSKKVRSESPAIAKMAELDERIGACIERYLSLNVFQSWLYESDRAEAAKEGDLERGLADIADSVLPQPDTVPRQDDDDDTYIESSGSASSELEEVVVEAPDEKAGTADSGSSAASELEEVVVEEPDGKIDSSSRPHEHADAGVFQRLE